MKHDISILAKAIFKARRSAILGTVCSRSLICSSEASCISVAKLAVLVLATAVGAMAQESDSRSSCHRPLKTLFEGPSC